MSENNIENIKDEQTKTTALGISVDDGRVRVPITNKCGEEIGVFYFQPTDIGIIKRYNSLVDDFDQITAPLENANITPDDTDNDEKSDIEIAAMEEAESRLYAACDKLFDGNMSEAFFGQTHPFSPVNGRFYCENALDAVGNFISKQFAQETKKLGTRVNKYTHGYAARTGKHKNGKR